MNERPANWFQVGVFAFSLTASSAASRAWGNPSEQVPVGPRAIALGSAYSAIADDASAVFWNPAGLPLLGHQELMGTNADLFGIGIRDNYLGFVLPLSPNQAVGSDWYHSRFQDSGDSPELFFGENRVSLAYGVRVRQRLFAGVAAKWLSRETRFYEVPLRQGQGFGADIGMLMMPVDRLRLGFAAQDLFGTKIRYEEGGSAEVYPRNLRFGSSYSFGRAGTVAFDVDDRWHLGLELRPLTIAAIRLGTEVDRRNSEGNTWTCGVGIKTGVFRFDYARVIPPTLGETDHFALSMEFNFNPAQVRIEKVTARDLYASLYNVYKDQEAVSIDLYNEGDEPLTAEVVLTIPDLMDGQAPPTRVELRPRAITTAVLPGAFSEKTLQRVSDGSVPVQVSVQYQGRRLPRTVKRSDRAHVYAPGAIDWRAGVERVCVQIDASDEAVDTLATRVGRVADRLLDEARAAESLGVLSNPNLLYAAALVDALKLAGFVYLPDPKNPFQVISQQEHAVDTVRYPFQTLQKLAGDCDDSSVLMAALLLNLGIPVKLVDAPGHLFLLAGSGIPERSRRLIGLADDRFVPLHGELWVPLETTAISKGFAEAWRKGAEEYQAWGSADLALVDVLEAQRRYPPASPRGARSFVQVPWAALADSIREDADSVNTWTAGAIEQSSGTSFTLLRAKQQLERGDVDAAFGMVADLLRQDPGSSQLRNNLAVILAARGQVLTALDNLTSALAADSTDAGIWLNTGVLITQALRDSTFAREALASGVDSSFAIETLAHGIDMSGGYEQACKLLGLIARDDLGRGDPRQVRFREIKDALRRYRGSQDVPSTSGGRRASVSKINDRVRTLMLRSPTTRSEPRGREGNSMFLYWKD